MKNVFIIITLLMLNSLSVIAETKSGTCGKNLTWALDDDGVLTIEGTGDMYDYSPTFEDYHNFAPWFWNKVVYVIIREGVNSIGSYAFECVPTVASVSLPQSLTSIGHGAFYGCSDLASINLPNGVKEIHSTAFAQCSFTSITIPQSVTSIAPDAFYGCI